MTFNRPKLEDLSRSFATEFGSRLNPSQSLPKRSLAYVMSQVLAGASHTLHTHLEWLSRQMFPTTCESEYLDTWAGIWGLERKLGTLAAIHVTFEGNDGALIPEGTEVTCPERKVFFRTRLDTEIKAGEGRVTCFAQQEGSLSNLDEKAELVLVSPLSEVSAVKFTRLDSLGRDEESDTDLRKRLLEHIKRTPMGGTKADYIAWVKKIPGISQVWVNGGEAVEPGHVHISFMMDKPEIPIPSAKQINEVREYLETVKPITAQITVSEPKIERRGVAIQIQNISDELQDKLEKDIKTLFFELSKTSKPLHPSSIYGLLVKYPELYGYQVKKPKNSLDIKQGTVLVLKDVQWL